MGSHHEDVQDPRPQEFTGVPDRSGIASLASAFYLERDAGVPGKNIHILEKDDILGGALDGAGEPDGGFVVRGGRMHEMNDECYWGLLSNIPSLEDPDVSVRDESYAFNEKYVSDGEARLVKDAQIVDTWSYGLSHKQETDFLKLSLVSDVRSAIGASRTGSTRTSSTPTSGTSGPRCSRSRSGAAWPRCVAT